MDKYMKWKIWDYELGEFDTVSILGAIGRKPDTKK